MLLCLNLTAQNQGRNWVFSDSIRLKFQSNGNIDQYSINLSGIQSHGSASVSDFNGDLLFYAGANYTPSVPALKVFRRDNSLLPNYNGVVSGISARTAQMILPVDTNGRTYCLVHMEYILNEPRHMLLTLSEIDLFQDGGMGSFTNKKGVVVNGSQDTLTQGMFAVRHANGRDWWIITHQWGNNTFVIVLVDSQLNYEIYRQSIGAIHSIDGQVYAGGNLPYFEYDKDRNKLIVSNGERLLEVFDFDRCTGLLNNPKTIFPPISMIVNPGLSFAYSALSNSGQFLYMVTFDFSDSIARILQFNMNSVDIPNSKKVLYETYGPNGGNLSQLGLAPNGKIYAICWSDTIDTTDVNKPNRYFLSTIENPDLPYPACNFMARGLWLKGRIVTGGIPDFIDYDLGPVDGSSCDTLGIDTKNQEDVSKVEIPAFPNPTSGLITVELQEEDFILYDLLGNKLAVLSSDTQGRILLPGYLSNGIYILQNMPEDKLSSIHYSRIQLLRGN